MPDVTRSGQRMVFNLHPSLAIIKWISYATKASPGDDVTIKDSPYKIASLLVVAFKRKAEMLL
jgi:hypothetical protein